MPRDRGSGFEPQIAAKRQRRLTGVEDLVISLSAKGLTHGEIAAHLEEVLTEYLQHYNAARPHRGLGQLTPAQADTSPPEPVNLAERRIRRKQVLGGLTYEYYVAA